MTYSKLPPPNGLPYYNSDLRVQSQKYSTGKHLKIIDILRAISAIFIILFHYTYRYNHNLYIVDSGATINFPFTVSWGYGAVVTFFILSGYFMAKYLDNIDINPFRFLRKRLWRLYPSFWASLAITTILLMIIFPEVRISLKQFICNLTMIPSNLDEPFIDGAYWTLAYEFKFAVIFCCILFFRSIKARKALLTVWLVASILLGITKDYVPNLMLFLVRGILITELIHSFICGISIANYRKNKFFYSTMILLCCLNQYCWYGLDLIQGLFFLSTAFIMLLLPILEKINLPNSIYKPLKFIALISYPLYLIHQMIGFGIIKSLKTFGLENELWLIVPFAVSVGLAYFIHRYVEQPAARINV